MTWRTNTSASFSKRSIRAFRRRRCPTGRQRAGSAEALLSEDAARAAGSVAESQFGQDFGSVFAQTWDRPLKRGLIVLEDESSADHVEVAVQFRNMHRLECAARGQMRVREDLVERADHARRQAGLDELHFPFAG